MSPTNRIWHRPNRSRQSLERAQTPCTPSRPCFAHWERLGKYFLTFFSVRYSSTSWESFVDNLTSYTSFYADIIRRRLPPLRLLVCFLLNSCGFLRLSLYSTKMVLYDHGASIRHTLFGETLQRDFEERVTRFVALLRPRDTIAEKYPHGLLIRRNNMVDACHAVLIVLLGVGEVNETVSLPTRMPGTRLSTRCHASVRSR